MNLSFKSFRGFTLIELLVVISIIGILSTVIYVPYNNTRKKGRDAQRISNMNSINAAIGLYFDKNGLYPNTNQSWRSQCPGWGSYANDQVIPGVVPKYLPKMPVDPKNPTGNNSSNLHCYLYISTPTGSQYKLLFYNMAESPIAPEPFVDPNTNRGPGGSDAPSWAVCKGASACTF